MSTTDARIAAILQDVCELPDYTSPEGQPDLLQCTVDELSAILEARLGPEPECVEVLRTTEEVIGRVTLHRRIFDGMPGYLRELEQCLVAARRALQGVRSSGEPRAEPQREKYGNEPATTEVDRLHARVHSLERLKDKLVDCNEIAQSLGFDTATDALHALCGMMGRQPPTKPVKL